MAAHRGAHYIQVQVGIPGQIQTTNLVAISVGSVQQPTCCWLTSQTRLIQSMTQTIPPGKITVGDLLFSVKNNTSLDEIFCRRIDFIFQSHAKHVTVSAVSQRSRGFWIF